MIEIVRPGALASIQDLGRDGLRRFGVGAAGALDQVALTVGNLLLGNAAGCAGIEFTLGRAALRFDAPARVALAGADCGARLDGEPVWCWRAFDAPAGSTLTLAAPASGTRTYLCVAGGIDAPAVLGSRSTDLKAGFGGHHGRALRPGDRLAWAEPAGLAAAQDGFGVLAPEWALPLRAPGVAGARPDTAVPIRMLPGLEYDQFDGTAQQALWSADWVLTPNSNRMGFRLAGPALRRLPQRDAELLSQGVVPGIMQVPPSGQPIVLMADAQTTGGYPRIGVVIEADLWRLAQLPLGRAIRFVQVDAAQADAARHALQAYLGQIETALRWRREGWATARRLRAGRRQTA